MESGGGGRVAVKVTSLPRPKSFDLCRLAARSYTNLSATRILSYIMYELLTFLLEIFIFFNCLLCISSFYRIRFVGAVIVFCLGG